MKSTRLAILLSLAALSLSPCRATELLIDGGFEESGTAGQFVGWTIQNQNGIHSSFQLEAPGTAAQGGPTAQNSPRGGNYYAVSDYYTQDDVGYQAANALLQTFYVPASFQSITLSFQMFVNSYAAISGTGHPLDYAISPSQYARVDILSADATAFDTGSGVVASLYLGGTTDFNEYSDYSFNLSSTLAASGTYQIRFADVYNQSYINMGVDNVSITAVDQVPEPSSLCMLGLGAAGLIWKGRKRFCR